MIQPESAPSLTVRQLPSVSLNWTRKRMNMRVLRASPSMLPRMPISFGCASVSHWLTVAQASGALRRADSPAAGSADSAPAASRMIRVLRI